MAKLHLILDGNPLDKFALDKERMTIGRRPSNQIQIDNLAVSGVHAAIVTIGNDSFLEDLNSTNGTMVNGKTIKKYVLQHEDIIEIGQYQLKYINENQPIEVGEAFEKTVMLSVHPHKQKQTVGMPTEKPQPMEKAVNQSSDEMNQASQLLPQMPVTDSVKPAVGRLRVTNGANAGRELLLNKTMTTLGKPGSQVAAITRRPHGYYITHVGGNGHPVVNGQIIGAQAHALNHQDMIELAGIKMEFHLA